MKHKRPKTPNRTIPNEVLHPERNNTEPAERNINNACRHRKFEMFECETYMSRAMKERKQANK